MDAVGALILIRGGGDLATGVAVRLRRCGFNLIVTELGRPLAVRREVAFAEAVYRGALIVEGIRAELTPSAAEIPALLRTGIVPVIVDSDASFQAQFACLAVIDARMRKRPPRTTQRTSFLVGLGPGFTAGHDCDAVVETNRGHAMGRVIWEGSAEADSGVPERVTGYDLERVLRAPHSGILSGGVPIGTILQSGDAIIIIDGEPFKAPFYGVLRGLLHDGLTVETGDKLGDLDPRADPGYAFRVSDKALAIGGGVLEALLSQPRIRTEWAKVYAAER
jgi:xanthine dehydrogenase accessory factor